MNLHRSSSQPDWQSVEPLRRNRWQQLAAHTHGIFTPGNIITVAGLALVFVGLILLWLRHYVLGLLALAVGRAFDLLDGLAAEATGTKSPLGETFDAAADKIGTFSTLLVLAAAGLANWIIIIAIALPHLIITVLAYRAERRGRRLHPSRLGKFSMAAAWLSLVLLLIPPIFNISGRSYANLPGLSLALISSVMGLVAAYKYFRDSR